MGQQQLLLLTLGAIVVGLALAIAFLMFDTQAVASNRDAVTSDLSHLASMAQAYYRKPRVLGGGGHSFGGMTMDRLTSASVMPKSIDGTFVLSPNPVSGNPLFVTLTGTGTETGNDGATKVRVVMYVYADSIRVDAASGN
jgi:hypothetical protein